MINGRKRTAIALADAEALAMRLLNLLLENGAFDPYFFPVNQRDLNAKDLLKDGHVSAGVLRDFTAELASREDAI